MRLTVPRVVAGWGVGRQIVAAHSGFVDNGRGRQYSMEDSDPNWADAFAAFSLVPHCVEPQYKVFTGVHFAAGAFTHHHTDPAPPGFVHVRCNVMLRKPQQGGNPIIDGETFEVSEGDLWLVLASLEVHGSEPVYGTRRIIKSFGGLVPQASINKIIIQPEN